MFTWENPQTEMLFCAFVYMFISDMILYSDKIIHYFYSFTLLQNIFMCLYTVSHGPSIS